MHEVTERTGTLLTVDEVQAGMGRTGRWWSFEQFGIVPDLFVVAKGLSAGYAPISAVVGQKEVIDALSPGQHLFTYGGHPPSAAVALAVLNHIESNDIPGNAGRIGGYLMSKLAPIQAEFSDFMLEVRGKGLMIGIQIDVSNDDLAGKIFATRCMELGAYVGFLGVKADVIRIEPPLNIDRRAADFISETVARTAIEVRTRAIRR